MISVIFKLIRLIYGLVSVKYHYLITKLLLIGNAVTYENFRTSGIPYIMVARGGKFVIGKNFSMHNGIKGNPIGCYSKCTFFVDRGAILIIGSSVGISQAAIICHQNIIIGDNVKIGGGVKIYDTDFHSLDYIVRNSQYDLISKAKAPVIIKNNAFIGAYCIILKGVTIGCNSIIGAGSVVTKPVPDNQIWAGNPAKYIRNL